MKLTAKQVRFVQEYLIEPNAKEAAIRAGYSAKTAAEIGHENLIKPHVAAEIEKARVKRAERCELSADWVVDELGCAERTVRTQNFPLNRMPAKT
jgi:phage terminase small subunit